MKAFLKAYAVCLILMEVFIFFGRESLLYAGLWYW